MRLTRWVGWSDTEFVKPPSKSSVRWDDSPLPRKVTLLLVLAVVGGCMVGVLEARLTQRIWPAMVGLTFVLIAVHLLAQSWVCQPYHQLLNQLDTLRMRRRAGSLGGLPVQRNDEIGAIARSVHEIGLEAIRSTHEAQQLRRTLDQRVEQATRAACGQLEQLAMRDPLTDLANRRFMETQMQPLVDTVQQSDEDLICLLIDLDDFKQVNDKLGHLAGDNVLVFLAGLIRGLVRREDYAVRLGGDVFAVFMPGCTVKRAAAVGKQLMDLFAQHIRTTLPRDAQCNLSVGISSLKEDVLRAVKTDAGQQGAGADNGHPSCPVATDPGLALIERADHRLYEAKRGGKAQIVAGPGGG